MTTTELFEFTIQSETFDELKLRVQNAGFLWEDAEKLLSMPLSEWDKKPAMLFHTTPSLLTANHFFYLSVIKDTKEAKQEFEKVLDLFDSKNWIKKETLSFYLNEILFVIEKRKTLPNLFLLQVERANLEKLKNGELLTKLDLLV
jgi:hypothetical protein